MRRILCSTAIVLALATPAYASDSKLIDILNNNNQEINTENLNQTMLDLMQGRNNTVGDEIQKAYCDPKNINGPFDDPATEMNECDIANVAPAAGDDGGDEPEESEPEDNTPNDELNDPEPPQEEPPSEEPPQEEPPSEEPPSIDVEDEETPPEDSEEDFELSRDAS